MTQEEKQLLLKDLSARLPYGVKIKYRDSILELDYSLYASDGTIAFEKYPMIYFMDKIDTVKPYLRLLSSMTEEEIFEFIQITDSVLRIGERKSTCILSLEQVDWLLSHHFDYRGLIEKGLAIEAPDNMYKAK